MSDETTPEDEAVGAAIDLDVMAGTLCRALLSLGRSMRMARDTIAPPEQLGEPRRTDNDADEEVNWTIRTLAATSRAVAKRLEKLLTEGA